MGSTLAFLGMGAAKNAVNNVVSGKQAAATPQTAGDSSVDGQSGQPQNGKSWTDHMGLILALGQAGLTVGSSINDVLQTRQWNKFEKKQQKADALANLKLAEFNANQMRDKAKYEANKLYAATAVSSANNGVVVGSDTSDQIIGNLIAANEYDAQMTMFNANDAYRRQLQQIKYNQIQKKLETRKNWWGVGGTLLSSIGAGVAAYGNWKKAGEQSSTPSISTSGSNTVASS